MWPAITDVTVQVNSKIIKTGLEFYLAILNTEQTCTTTMNIDNIAIKEWLL